MIQYNTVWKEIVQIMINNNEVDGCIRNKMLLLCAKDHRNHLGVVKYKQLYNLAYFLVHSVHSKIDKTLIAGFMYPEDTCVLFYVFLIVLSVFLLCCVVCRFVLANKPLITAIRLNEEMQIRKLTSL